MSCSSAKKKQRPLVQCRHCTNFYLAKDFEEHTTGQGGQQNGMATATESHRTNPPAGTPTAKQTKTKKTAAKYYRRKTTGGNSNEQQLAADSSSIPSPSGDSTPDGHCDGRGGYLQSQLPCIQPERGLALREESMDHSIGTKWDQCFPMELHGWHRRHSALVHPEVLNALGVLPRSHFMLIPTSGSETNGFSSGSGRVVTLWPYKEIPLMRVAISPSLKRALPWLCTTDDEQQQPPKLLKLALITSYGPSLIHLTLRPNIAETKQLTIGCWRKLSKLSHFPYFLRSYFVYALIAPGQPKCCLELFYYGRLLLFDLIECQQEQQQQFKNAAVGQQMESNCSLNANGDTGEEKKAAAVAVIDTKKNLIEVDDDDEEAGDSQARFHRISAFCKFEIQWESVISEQGQAGGVVDDSESLL